jgi:hypothetical protein
MYIYTYCYTQAFVLACTVLTHTCVCLKCAVLRKVSLMRSTIVLTSYVELVVLMLLALRVCTSHTALAMHAYRGYGCNGSWTGELAKLYRQLR